jgi:hypothetical protein
MREATRCSPVPVYWIDSGLPGEMRFSSHNHHFRTGNILCKCALRRSHGRGRLRAHLCRTNSKGEQSHANFGDVYLHIMGIRSREQTWPQKTFYLPRQKRLPR